MKLIKSATLYKAQLPSFEALKKHLEENKFEELTSLEFSKSGFINNPFTHEILTKVGDTRNSDLVFTLRYDEKIIPASVINAESSKVIKAREESEGRRLPRKERAGIRDDVFNDILPKAFVKSNVITCYYRPEASLLIVPTTTKLLSSVVVSRLVGACGSVKFTSIVVDGIKQSLTSRLESHLTEGSKSFRSFNICGTAKLKGSDGRAVSFKLHDIDEAKEGVLEAIKQSCKVSEIGLSDDSIEFRIDDDYKLKGISFIAEPDDTDFDSVEDQFKHEAAVQISLISSVSERLLRLFEYKEAA